VPGIVAFIDVRLCFQTKILNCKIFGRHPKVMLPQHIYACNFVVITMVGPTKVSIMKFKCTVLNRMWQHDFMMKQIFFSSIFLSENTGWLVKQADYPGHNPWHARYNLKSNSIWMTILQFHYCLCSKR
jgi:hypothetical protein